MATLTFLGAAGTVTGSKYLLECDGHRLMVDCGLFQGLRELRQRNWATLGVPPRTIEAVVLTHAHLDHIGYLPRLVEDGFTGPVFSTRATRDLGRLILLDSARLQEEDAEHANEHGYSKHNPALPLYTEGDAQHALALFHAIAYGQAMQAAGVFSFDMRPAGHILGSAIVEMNVREGNASTTVVFSGDLGGYNRPILPDPAPIAGADVLLLESTYGDRVHERADMRKQFSALIRRTVASGGKVIIPAFAVGRAQEVLYLLRELMTSGELPRIPVYLDSPMAVEALPLYEGYREEHDAEMRALEATVKPFEPPDYHPIHNVAESTALVHDRRPAIVISASGMATGGRVLHHLEAALPEPRDTVIFVGYQAVGTRGRQLLEGVPTVKIHGRMIDVRARITHFSAFSAHGDESELLRWLRGFERPPRQTYLIHGEARSAEALQEKIRSTFGWTVDVAQDHETVTL